MATEREIVLIITAQKDETADAVETELARRSCPLERFDLGDFPSTVRFAARNSQTGWGGDLYIGSTSVDLGAIKAVYYRRPSRFALPAGLSPGDAVFATTEARLGFGGPLSSLPVLWVNHPGRVAMAEYKSAQLATATEVGMSVPRTLITNDITSLRSFAAEIDSPLVCKTFSSLMLTDGVTPESVFTTIINPAAVDERQFAVTAHLIQEWIPKAFEVRVTMVGPDAYATAIHAHSEPARIDWRADYGALTYEHIEPPTETLNSLRQYMTAFGLNFGAFDFIVEHDGSWRFLECNSNGQWLWIEHEVGLPIASALAELLDRGGRSSC